MQFVLLLYEDEANFHSKTEEEQMAVVQDHMAFSEELRAAGAYLSGMPLEPGDKARCLRNSGAIEDGPFADTKEQLGGFYVISASSMEEAEAWAKKCPAYKEGTIEIRPVPDYGG